jgi:exopolysaccharide production protein ExoQ
MSIAPPPETASGFIAGGRLSPAVAQVSPAPSFPVRLLFAVFLIFDFPAFTIQLAMDPTTGRWTGSPLLQLITISSELFVFVFILSSRNMRDTVLRCWPVLILVAIAFASSVWSYNRGATIKASNTYMTAALFGLTMVGAFPQFQCIRFAIRTMALGCLLSILWVLMFPEVAIHQLTDPYQTVHAGLWRGVFSHKQGLGYFSGLTTGLLLFYRTSIFPAPILAFFVVCSITCLVGTQSATGIVASVITPAFLYIAYSIARLPMSLRKPIFLKFAIGFAAIGVGYKIGILNYVIVQILGKSTDLSGRADFWPIILQNFYSSGYSLFGGGFNANIAAEMSEWSVDNGYVDKFIEFGYVFSPIIFGIFALILWGGIHLILKTPAEHARTNIFPFAIWSVTLILNITESNFMTKCLSTVLTSIAVGLIFSQKQSMRSFPSLHRRPQIDFS